MGGDARQAARKSDMIGELTGRRLRTAYGDYVLRTLAFFVLESWPSGISHDEPVLGDQLLQRGFGCPGSRLGASIHAR